MAKPRLAPPSIYILKSLHNSIPRHSDGQLSMVRRTSTDARRGFGYIPGHGAHIQSKG